MGSKDNQKDRQYNHDYLKICHSITSFPAVD